MNSDMFHAITFRTISFFVPREGYRPARRSVHNHIQAAIKKDVIPSELSVALIMIRYTSLSWQVNSFLIAGRSQSLRRYLPLPPPPPQIYLHHRVPVWYSDDKNNLVSSDRVI